MQQPNIFPQTSAVPARVRRWSPWRWQSDSECDHHGGDCGAHERHHGALVPSLPTKDAIWQAVMSGGRSLLTGRPGVARRDLRIDDITEAIHEMSIRARAPGVPRLMCGELQRRGSHTCEDSRPARS